MNNTALREKVPSANNKHMVFANEEHEKFYSREQRARWLPADIHDNRKPVFYCMTNAARVKYPAALLRSKLDAPSACCGVFDCR